LLDYLQQRKVKYTNIIGIKPSGWEFASGKSINTKSYLGNRVKIIGKKCFYLLQNIYYLEMNLTQLYLGYTYNYKVISIQNEILHNMLLTY